MIPIQATGNTGAHALLGVMVARSGLILLVFWVAWHASAIFEVRPHVSALYLGCGVTFAVAVLYGWRYLFSAYLAAVIATLSSYPELSWLEADWVGPLRQTLIYGLAGLSVRHLWVTDVFRLSLPVSLRFILTALVASLTSATLAMNMPPFNALTLEERTEAFFSFWGGDFAGVMVLVPILLLLHQVFRRAKLQAGAFTGWWRLDSQILKEVLLLVLFGCAITAVVILMPVILQTSVRVDVLILIPVLLAGLWRGAFVAFLVGLILSLMLIFVRPWLGIPAGLTIELQLLIAMNAAVALLAGASHDDKNFAWEKANFDSLTKLVNHSCFVDRLEQEILRFSRSNKPFTLMYLDLDGFKSINDTYGHSAGDEVLRKTAERLRHQVRASDTVARLGGDEFAIILSETSDPADVERLGQALLESLAMPIDIGQATTRVTASIGIVSDASGESSAKQLMNRADMAMYAAKKLGKNRYSIDLDNKKPL